jgi:phospholipase C
MVQAADKIKHVFVLMLENRSFDHLLGQSGIAGINVPSNTDANLDPRTNQYISAGPFPSGPVYQLDNSYRDPSHEFIDALEQLTRLTKYPPNSAYPANKIDNSGFVIDYHDNAKSQKEDTVMYGFTAEQLPILNSLARQFAVCDCWFSALPGPTVPNRLFVHAGTSGGLDDSPSPFTLALQIGIQGIKFANGNIYDRIDAKAGTPNAPVWHIYKGGATALVEQVGDVKKHPDRIHALSEMKGLLAGYTDSPTYNFIEPKYDLLGNYKNGNSQHPYGDVRAGEALIKEVFETIQASAIWKNSLLIITYDEHGGFYDHVAPPPAVPPGDTVAPGIKSKNHFLFDNYGIRVPALFISPFTNPGMVVKSKPGAQFDHTSIIKTLCELWGLDPLTNRDRSARSILPELLDVQRTSSIEPLTEVILPDGLLEAINQPETSASDSAEAYAGENTQADLDGMIYTHLQLTMMNNLQGLSPEDATAKVEELGNSITTKAQALDYMNGVSNVPLNNETGAA